MIKIALILGSLVIVSAFKIPVGYNFGYDIQSADDANAREESRDADGNVKGFYMLRDADGRLRKVSYTAGKDGFNAQVESNEPGVLSKSSANVQVNGAELPKPEPAAAAAAGGLSEADTAPTDSGLVPVGYDFGYDVQGETDSHSRKESSQNGVVRGSYSLTDSDGRTRKVTYTADENGFNAAIDTNEQGTADKSPANVEIRSPFKAPVPVEALPVNQVAVQQLANAELPAPEHRQTIVHEQQPQLVLTQDAFPTFNQAPVSQPILLPAIQIEPITQAPVTQEFLKSTAHAEEDKYTSNVYSKINYSKAPITQVKQEQIPLEPIRQEKLATKSFAPDFQYTSNVFSKINYAQVAQAPLEQVIEQAPLEQVREEAPLTQIREQKPLTQIRESKPLTQVKTQAPLELPVYTTKMHSKMFFAKAPEPVQQLVQEQLPIKGAPITQERLPVKGAPISQERLPVKGAPITQERLPVKGAPISQERLPVKGAPITQERLPVKGAPITQERLPVKGAPITQERLPVKGAPVTKQYQSWSYKSAPITQQKSWSKF